MPSMTLLNRMKKILLSIIFVLSTSSVYAGGCLDLQTNLSKGDESDRVLSLQNFLLEKGFLKAKPNGYFGPGTINAVKLYQKSVGLSSSGAVFPLTRASIKKDTCGNTASVTSQTSNTTFPKNTTNTTVSATSTATSTNNTSQSPRLPPPTITSADKAAFISGGIITNPFVINGTNFSTSSNFLVFQPQNAGKIYTVGPFNSFASGTVMRIIPAFVKDIVPCGLECKEMIPPGGYDISVQTEWGKSNTAFISIKSFTSKTESGAIGRAIPVKSTDSRIGTLTFSSSVAVALDNITISLAGDSSKVSGIFIKDDVTGKVIKGSNTYDLGKALLSENQSRIFGIYASTNLSDSGSITVTPTLNVTDYIGSNSIKIPLQPFLVTISG